MEKGELTDHAPAKRAKLAGTVSQMLSTIDVTYGDTPSVALRKRAWESFRVASRATVDAMENSQHEFANHAKQLTDSFAVVIDRLRVSLQSVFERWARLQPHDVMNDRQTEPKQFTHELESQFNGLQANSEQHEFDDELLARLYATIGSVRGLVDAMANAQMVLNQINWKQWATPRFELLRPACPLLVTRVSGVKNTPLSRR